MRFQEKDCIGLSSGGMRSRETPLMFPSLVQIAEINRLECDWVKGQDFVVNFVQKHFLLLFLF